MDLVDMEHVRRSGTALHFLAVRWHDTRLCDDERAARYSRLSPSEGSLGGGGGSTCATSPFFCTSVECVGAEDAAELEDLVVVARQQAPVRFRRVGNGVIVLPIE